MVDGGDDGGGGGEGEGHGGEGKGELRAAAMSDGREAAGGDWWRRGLRGGDSVYRMVVRMMVRMVEARVEGR